MKKWIAVLLCLSLFLIGCGETDIRADISDVLGMDIAAARVLISEDSHGGFHGDGETYVVLQFPTEYSFSPAQDKRWHNLPLTENLHTLLYEYRAPMLWGDKDQSRVPEIENGYYFFHDRQNEIFNCGDDSDVLVRASVNFILAVYDTDTDTLYYYEHDT